MSLWPEVANGSFSLGFKQAGAIRTRVLEAGSSGEPVIFIHGTAGHLEAYQRNILAHAERYRVLALDMIGHGFTDKPDHPYEIKHYVRHLKDVIDAYGFERVHLSGESLGGWIVAQFAIEHPERVGKLVLNTAGGLNTDPAVMTRLRETSLKAVQEPTRENVRKRLEWLVHDKAHVTEDLVDMRYRIYTQPGFAKAMENILCLQIMDIRERNILTDEALSRIQAPTLVVWTDHDPTAGIPVGERFARVIPNARLTVFEGCAHWPQYEDAERFNNEHMAFLAG